MRNTAATHTGEGWKIGIYNRLKEHHFFGKISNMVGFTT
jgi:hypothetical protein